MALPAVVDIPGVVVITVEVTVLLLVVGSVVEYSGENERILLETFMSDVSLANTELTKRGNWPLHILVWIPGQVIWTTGGSVQECRERSWLDRMRFPIAYLDCNRVLAPPKFLHGRH